jgi:hypothetical protein
MKARLFSCFVLILSLALLANASGGVAQQSAPTLSSHQPEAPEGVAVQQQAHEVQLVGQIGGGGTSATAVQGTYAYTAVGKRLVILDVSNPANLAVVAETDVLPGAAGAVAVAGDHAYLADGDGGLRILDVSDPIAPSEVGFYATPGYARALALAENYAYLAVRDSGLRILDVSDPSAPSEVGFYDTPGSTGDVALAGDYIYVADGENGLAILRYLPYQVYLPLVLRSHPQP